MAGVLVGCFISCHLGDLIGRKPTYFLSILIFIIFNVVAYFSVSWKMYAAVRFMLGAGCGFFITVYRNQIIEYATSVWRVSGGGASGFIAVAYQGLEAHTPSFSHCWSPFFYLLGGKNSILLLNHILASQSILPLSAYIVKSISQPCNFVFEFWNTI